MGHVPLYRRCRFRIKQGCKPSFSQFLQSFLVGPCSKAKPAGLRWAPAVGPAAVGLIHTVYRLTAARSLPVSCPPSMLPCFPSPAFYPGFEGRLPGFLTTGIARADCKPQPIFSD